jgi:hypothetical protein
MLGRQRHDEHDVKEDGHGSWTVQAAARLNLRMYTGVSKSVKINQVYAGLASKAPASLSRHIIVIV